MTCHEVQLNTSLYLYGELDFAQEEALEGHVADCALCQRMLEREKAWHTSLKSSGDDVRLDLLSRCRQDLHVALDGAGKSPSVAGWERIWWERISSGFSLRRGSMQLALASFIFFVGFGAAHWVDRNGVPEGLQASGPFVTSSVLGPSTTRIREIQPAAQDQVRIIVEQVQDGEVTGRIADQDILRLLLTATRDSIDPGVRVDSVEMLNRQVLDQQALSGREGNDIRDVLLNSVRQDSNAAVRLKALEGLRRFAGDPLTRETLKFVLQNDENAGVRSEAIDILAPANGTIQITPDLAGTLQDLMRSLPDDDYVRARCQQVLRTTNAAFDVY
jgi:hypothetical protein